VRRACFLVDITTSPTYLITYTQPILGVLSFGSLEVVVVVERRREESLRCGARGGPTSFGLSGWRLATYWLME
jgi:hypothetical protein